jgi:hypothetical protein
MSFFTPFAFINQKPAVGLPIITDSLQQYLDANLPASNPGSGTTWFDLSGNSRNGTLNSGASFASASGVNFVDLDGTDDYVDCGDFLSNPYNPFTIQGWILMEGATSAQQVFFSKWDDVGNNRQWFIMNRVHTNSPNGNVGFLIDATGNFTNTLGTAAGSPGSPIIANISTNVYNNYALTYDNQTVRLYFNGNFVTSAAFGSTTDLTNLSADIYLGKDGQGRFLNGRVGQWIYYSKKLSDAEVLSNHNNTKAAYVL